ncbi:ATP-binding protein [Candidatus Omnitrophota bacterium]
MFSDPVVGEKFFGRQAILSLLAKRAGGLKDGFRQNIAILGPKLIGKSSLILHFFSHFQHPQIIPIYIDLRANSFHHFVYKFIGTLLYQCLKNKGLEGTDEFITLKKNAQKHIPKTLEAISAIENNMKNAQSDKAFAALINLTTTLKQESGISAIVMLDEFHFLDSYKLRAPYANLAKEIMVQKDTMYILLSSQVNYAKKVLIGELSLLFGNFETLYLEHFDYPTSCKFLQKRFQHLGLPDNLQDFLIDFCKGHPFYLDSLSTLLVEKARSLKEKKAAISPRLIAEAFNSLIYHSTGILNQYFTSRLSHNLNGADYSNFIPILLSATESGAQLRQIAQVSGRQPKKITKQINYLLEKDLLTKVGAFYRIQDRLFRFWLKSVYQRKSGSLAQDPNAESEEFLKEIEDLIAIFTQQNQLNLAEKVSNLLKSCNNEIVMLHNKLFRFWRFEEVRPWPKPNSQEYILARYKEGCWLFWIKNEGVDETRLQEFINLSKKSKLKIRKLILITLKKLDLNVKLLALEKRVWIWTKSELNLILDLYGKQQVVT